MIGEIISHYRIIEKLGEGGMGAVYKAEDTRLKRIVALKFLPRSLTGDANAKQRFIHEAQSASALRHNNVCTLHDISETEDSNLFIVMDCYEGETLKKKIEKGSIKIDEVIDISAQVCEGLARAHEKGLIHRDIKPSNIFITNDGTVKIIDFGLAKLSEATELTKDGTAPGTISFMSPEQIKCEEINQRSDIWALGVVMYEMITGQQPFKCDFEQAITYSILSKNPESITRIRTGVPMELERIVLKMLEKDPDERYQHIDDVLADLKKTKKEISGDKKGRSISSSTMSGGSGIYRNGKQKIFSILIPAAIIIILVFILLLYNPFYQYTKLDSSSQTPVNSLAVMYFENIPDPSDNEHTSAMLTNLLITSLSQVKGLEVISGERLLDVQKDLGDSDVKQLSPELAGKVAERAGANIMLIGSILQDKPTFTVTTRLINVETGKIINSQQVRDFPRGRIFGLVDTLSGLLQNDFQFGRVSSAEIKPVAEVTTNSPEAYRLYVQGLELTSKLYKKEAAEIFRQAIKLDERFAMAYFYLGYVLINSGYLKQAEESFIKAASFKKIVTDREQLLISVFVNLMKHDFSRAEELLNEMTEKYPHEIVAYNLYMWIYNSVIIKPEKSVEKCLQGLQYNPSSKMLYNYLAYAYTFLNNRTEAINSVQRYIKLVPAEPNPYDTEGDVYAWFGEYDSSARAYEKAVSLRRDFISASRLGFYEVIKQNYEEASEFFQMSGYTLPVITIHRGMLNTALKNWPERQSYSRKFHLFYEMRQYSEMLLAAEKYSKELKELPSEIIYGRGLDYIAWALAKNGKFKEANNIINEIRRDAVYLTPKLQCVIDNSQALVLFEEGKYESALKLFEKVLNTLPVNHEPNLFHAICLFKCGHLSMAVRELQRLIYWPNFLFILDEMPGTQTYWPITVVKSHYWLGRAYEQQGYIEKAIGEYQKFIELWKNADFESPELNDARERLQI